MPISAKVDKGTPQKIGSKTFTWDLTSTIYNNRTAATNTLRVPQFILPLYAEAPQAEDAAWWQTNLGVDGIPAGTDLMIVRMNQPYEKFDTNSNYTYDFRTRMILYNWEDANADGLVWHDGKISGVADGSVDYTSLTTPVTIDAIYDLDWATAEVDQYEYVRYAYSYMTGNHQEVMIQKPLERSTDGIFIGLYIGVASLPSFPITYTFEVEFYQYDDLSWLEVLDATGTTPISSVMIPADGTATITARVNVPADMPVGDYEASIKLVDPGFNSAAPIGANPPVASYPAHTSVIPVTLHVAGTFDGSENMTLGGPITKAYDEKYIYNNATVRGYFDWAWREESGDWRFFYVDHTNPEMTTFGTTDHIVVKDTWEDVPTYKTDIDTIVLGPSPSPVDPWGGWMLPDPDYFGPYTLDIVGRSPDVRSGRSVWNFNTSSGANEDWVMVKPSYEDALYEYLQHNVLFHGNQDSVMFTKTVGTVRTAPEVLNVTAYVDSGSAGAVTISSSLPFEGLVADAYGLGGPMSYSNVALGYNGTGSFDWTKSFTVTHGAKIEITTSSSTISDIDLALYYCGPSGTPCVQKASSAGATSDESVMVLKPADGIWVMAVDNYSGPAGTFNYEEKIVQGTNLTVSGTTGDLVPAGTEKTLNITFNKTGMEAGKTYEGLLLLGNSKAAALVEVPIYVTRAQSSARIEKSVDYDLTFPGETLVYTVKVYNQSDPAASFGFEDPIPTGTAYVPGSVTGGASYDPINNKIVYNGPIIGATVEGFESGAVPPAGWTRIQTNTRQTWHIDTYAPHSGSFDADILYDDLLGQQDEWLVSPEIAVAGGEALEFWSFGSLTWCKVTYDNCDLKAWLVVDGVGGGNDILLGKADDAWTASWVYAQSTFNLPATLPAGELRIGFQYFGTDGAEVGLDDIKLPGSAGMKTFTYAVNVDNPLPGGTEITNIASLTAKHDLPTGMQVEPTVTAEAVTTIGFPANFSTSYKEAPAKAKPNDIVEYKIHAINSGDAAATITLSDPIPAGTTYYDHDWSIPYQNFMYDGATEAMLWEGTIGPHSEWTFTFWVRVDATHPRGANITNTASFTWPVGGLKEVTAVTNVPQDTYLPFVNK